MPPERPRSSSFSALGSGGGRGDIELTPMPASSGRREAQSASGSSRRSERAQLSALDMPTGRPSRTIDALDLAHPKGVPLHRADLVSQAAASMRNAGKHGLDVTTLVGALGAKGKDATKLTAHIEKNLGMHQAKHAEFAQQFASKGFSALQQAPALAMKGVNSQLSAALEHRKKK